MTELRCRSCTMLGGTIVESKREVDELLALPELRGNVIEVGDEVELPPCIPAHELPFYERDHGRPCPRVELDEDNAIAASLCSMTLQTHLQALVGPMIEAALVHEDADEHREVVLRIANVLQSERLRPHLFPTPDELKAQRGKG